MHELRKHKRLQLGDGMGKKSKIVRTSDPRKQHTISRMHLDRFCDGCGNLYVYEKGKKFRKSRAVNEAVQRDYFECKLPGYETNFKIERTLARLEHDASQSYEKLIRGDNLTTREAAAWALFVASLFLRSKKVREELSPRNFEASMAGQLEVDLLREDQWKIFDQTGQLISLDEIRGAKANVLKAFSDPALRQVVSLDFSTPNLARALAKKRWQVVRPAQGLKFVTNDAPAVSFCFREGRSFVGLGWGHEETHVAIPLDPDHLFIASPVNVQWLPQLDEANTINFVGTMAQFSYRNVYASLVDERIQELVEQHSGTLIFGRDAYIYPAA
jgi:Protein of unknown function (DUF4238)